MLVARGRRRRRTARVVVAAALALVAGSVTAGLVHRAAELAGRYGEHATYAVARRDLAPGDTIAASDVDWRSLPVALVAGRSVGEAVGRTVVAPIIAGEPIVEERLAPHGTHGPMALAPDGTRAIAVPSTGAVPPVAAGDRVDVYAVSIDGSGRTQRVAGSAVVLAVDEHAVTVAVERGEVAATARAALEQNALLALVAPVAGSR